MKIALELRTFLDLDRTARLDSWRLLTSIAQQFIASKSTDKIFAQELALCIYRHRSLMGSSKAYESATEIDMELCELSIVIARIAYGNSSKMKDFLECGIYYSNFNPQRFDKQKLEKELSEIK